MQEYNARQEQLLTAMWRSDTPYAERADGRRASVDEYNYRLAPERLLTAAFHTANARKDSQRGWLRPRSDTASAQKR